MNHPASDKMLSQDDPAVQKLPNKIVTIVLVATLSRLLINTARRFIYTFAPAIGKGLGVPLTSITSLIAMNQATSILGMFIAPLGDRFGYKLMLVTGMLCLSIGTVATGVLPFYGVLLLTLFLTGLGKAIFDPAIQAFAGQHIPYEKRGTVIGIMEIAWAGSAIIGIPFAGFLIEKGGWQAPFLALGILSIIALVCILIWVPAERNIVRHPGKEQRLHSFWKELASNRPALGALVFIMCISIANDNIFIVYGIWLKDSFNLSILALGIGTMVIGAAEICGESLTALFADRIGLGRSVIIGLCLSTGSFLILLIPTGSLTVALSMLFFIFLSFEFSLVTSIGFCTELVPESRAAMMSTFYAASGFGRVIGAFMGGWSWSQGGLQLIAIESALFTFIALLALIWGMGDRS